MQPNTNTDTRTSTRPASPATHKPAGPPWLDPERQHAVGFRDGDVVVSVPVKSGTNWMMNVVHQLLTGGDADFASIYDVVAWPEFVERPGQPAGEVAARLDAVGDDRRRVFKSHTPPGPLPYFAPGAGPAVKYVVVCRNPEEAMVSFKKFLEKHTDEFYELWGVPRAALTREDFPTWYREVADAKGMQGMIFDFAARWWPHRLADNVLMLHFADLKRDLPGAVRKVATFLDVEPGADQWSAIDQHVTFDWMKENQVKFETISTCVVPALEHGAMVRKGVVGRAHEDGMTDEIATHLREVGARICQDADALRWLYEGGEL